MTAPRGFLDSVLEGAAPATPVGDLGLRGRGSVYLQGGRCAFLVDRKSRFLRKDAVRVMETLVLVSEHVGRPLEGHVLVKRAPVCSQARAWLEEQGVQVEQHPA